MTELVCYLHPGWAPHIRPAEATRDWMDATGEHFAYRCLPLNIANAHGWEVLSPCDFEACWRGGSGVGDVIIRTAPGTASSEAPVSIFGQAVLTFHIQGIFRTEPGWNLFVTGSPNAGRDGIVPLSGVIETDWSPYSFTMNWRFVRRNHWVKFKKGDPICFFFPVQRQALEQIQPRFAPMTDDLLAQFKAWSVSRDAFRIEMEQNPPKAPADKWQKRYYRGIDMNDRQGVADHKARLRLAPFAPSDAPVPPSPKTLELRGDAETMGRMLRGVAFGLALGTAPDALAAGLKELGLNEADASAVIAASRLS
jgi:hypothetical protein